MSCCGEREKLGDERPEQKWNYIVCTPVARYSCLLLTGLESVRFQIFILHCTSFLRYPLYLPADIGCCVRCGCVHRCESSFFQPLVRSGATSHTFQHSQVGFRRMHHALLAASGLSMATSNPSHEKRRCSRQLPRSSCRKSSVSADGQEWLRLETLSPLRRAHQGA